MAALNGALVRVVPLVAAFLIAAWARDAAALEKASRRFVGEEDTEWRTGATCSVSYYNVCTGWVWTWSGWSPGDRVGVAMDTCCPGGGVLESSRFYASTGAPSGYGFTGTIAVYEVDGSGCLGSAISPSQSFLPVTGWNSFTWSVSVPSVFAIVATHGIAPHHPAGYPTDHPAAGPTGPAACGRCYPTNRTPHSYYWGTASSPLCPGVAFDDGACAAELVADAALSCTVTSVGAGLEFGSWGRIKSLYR